MKHFQLTNAGEVDIDALVRQLRITKREFAIATGLPADAVTRNTRKNSARTQRRVKELLDVLGAVQNWAGSLGAAWSWYRSQPLSSLGGLTAEALVTQGRAREVCAYINQISDGGYT